MIEAYVGRLGLPAAIVVAVIAVVYGFNSYDSRHVRNDLRAHVVKACASKPDPSVCASNLISSLNKAR